MYTTSRLVLNVQVRQFWSERPQEKVRSSESNPDPNRDGPCVPNETGHSTIYTSGLIVLPLWVTEAQGEVKVMSRHKRSPIEVIIYRLENYHQVGSGALYKLSRKH
jgi:hypothetical protein